MIGVFAGALVFLFFCGCLFFFFFGVLFFVGFFFFFLLLLLPRPPLLSRFNGACGSRAERHDRPHQRAATPLIAHECLAVFYGGRQVGTTIGKRSGVPVDEEPWGGSCGFYPGIGAWREISPGGVGRGGGLGGGGGGTAATVDPGSAPIARGFC